MTETVLDSVPEPDHGYVRLPTKKPDQLSELDFLRFQTLCAKQQYYTEHLDKLRLEGEVLRTKVLTAQSEHAALIKESELLRAAFAETYGIDIASEGMRVDKTGKIIRSEG